MSHGWINLAPNRWDYQTNLYSRYEYIPGNDSTVTISAYQEKSDQINLTISSPTHLSQKLQELLFSKLERALSVHTSRSDFLEAAETIDPDVAAFIKNGGGRFLKSTSLFEDVVKTLLTTNTSWTSTKMMVLNMVANYGINSAFPDITNLHSVTELDLRNNCKIGYRAKYLISIIRYFLSEGSDSQYKLADKYDGLGPYGMAHIRLLNEIFKDIPIDSEVRSYCMKQFNLSSDNQIVEHFSKWKQHAFLGYKIRRQMSNSNWIG